MYKLLIFSCVTKERQSKVNLLILYNEVVKQWNKLVSGNTKGK